MRRIISILLRRKYEKGAENEGGWSVHWQALMVRIVSPNDPTIKSMNYMHDASHLIVPEAMNGSCNMLYPEHDAPF